MSQKTKKSSPNVISLDEFRKNRGVKKSVFPPDEEGAHVVDFESERQTAKDNERRLVTRTVLSQFVGVFVLIQGKGLQSSSLYDVSDTGLAFDMPVETGKFEVGEEVAMRIYLSHDTYFPFTVKVSNVRTVGNGTGVVRHGATFMKKDPSFSCLSYFVKFLQEVSLVSRKDRGERVLGRVD